MAKSPFKMRSGNSTPFKQMGSSPSKQDNAFDQEKITLKTRKNPNTGETEKYATGYDADIDDIRRAKAIKGIHDDITDSSNEGTRAGVSPGGIAEKAGYSGGVGGATMLRKGIFENKYNIGNKEGKYASKLGEEGTDVNIAKRILKENEVASQLTKDIDFDSTVLAESETRGLKYNPSKKKKKNKTKTTSTKSKKVDYARSLLKDNKQ